MSEVNRADERAIEVFRAENEHLRAQIAQMSNVINMAGEGIKEAVQNGTVLAIVMATTAAWLDENHKDDETLVRLAESMEKHAHAYTKFATEVMLAAREAAGETD